MEKILWVKFGWSEFYQGGPVDGNFPWDSLGEVGHEAFNFMPDSDGIYYCYVPPQGDGQGNYHQPSNDDSEGWTVVCLAKRPKQKGIHIVGWFEDATLEGEYLYRPHSPVTGQRQVGKDGDWHYSIRSKKAFLVPPAERTRPFSHVSVGQGKYSFLAGPEVKKTQNKSEVLKLVKRRLEGFNAGAVKSPDPEHLADPENDPLDPARSFGTPEHRRKVEKAAEEAVVAYYTGRDYVPDNVTKKKLGYDFTFTKGRLVELVEIKGTSEAAERFFMTRNEFAFKSNKGWRLAIVTDALSEKSVVRIYTLKQFERRFALEPLAYVGASVQE